MESGFNAAPESQSIENYLRSRLEHRGRSQ